MKFLYFQDFHIAGRNSKHRLGNYFEDCLLKLDEIISIAKENKCDFLLDGGDLFETDKPSYNILDIVADKIEKAEIPVYSLFGNHAMSYGHIENSNATGLAHLQKRSKYFKRLIDYYDKTVHIVGIDYEFGIEEKLKDYPLLDFMSAVGEEKRWKIAIVHALVTPGKFFDNTSYIDVKDIKTNADLVLLAHYHHPFKKIIGKTTFLNIGCCGRMNINEAKIEPSVLLIDTNTKNYKVIKLISTKSSHEIFDLKKYEELKDNKKDIQEFLNALRDVNFQSMDIAQQIFKIGNEQNIEKNVIDYVLQKVNENRNGQ